MRFPILSLELCLCSMAQPFEVASVKPDTSPAGRGQPVMDAQRLIWHGATLKRMICEAYKVQYAQVLGAPAWTDTERYDVEAKAEKPSTPDQLRVMPQLVAERFQLTMQPQRKALPVFVLTVAAGGVKMRTTAAEDGANDRRSSIAFSGGSPWRSWPARSPK